MTLTQHSPAIMASEQASGASESVDSTPNNPLPSRPEMASADSAPEGVIPGDAPSHPRLATPVASTPPPPPVLPLAEGQDPDILSGAALSNAALEQSPGSVADIVGLLNKKLDFARNPNAPVTTFRTPPSRHGPTRSSTTPPSPNPPLRHEDRDLQGQRRRHQSLPASSPEDGPAGLSQIGAELPALAPSPGLGFDNEATAGSSRGAGTIKGDQLWEKEAPTGRKGGRRMGVSLDVGSGPATEEELVAHWAEMTQASSYEACVNAKVSVKHHAVGWRRRVARQPCPPELRCDGCHAQINKRGLPWRAGCYGDPATDPKCAECVCIGRGCSWRRDHESAVSDRSVDQAVEHFRGFAQSQLESVIQGHESSLQRKDLDAATEITLRSIVGSLRSCQQTFDSYRSPFKTTAPSVARSGSSSKRRRSSASERLQQLPSDNEDEKAGFGGSETEGMSQGAGSPEGAGKRRKTPARGAKGKKG